MTQYCKCTHLILTSTKRRNDMWKLFQGRSRYQIEMKSLSLRGCTIDMQVMIDSIRNLPKSLTKQGQKILVVCPLLYRRICRNHLHSNKNSIRRLILLYSRHLYLTMFWNYIRWMKKMKSNYGICSIVAQ